MRLDRRSALARLCAGVAGTWAALVKGLPAFGQRRADLDEPTAAAFAAWRDGDFARARSLALQSDGDPARHVLALVAHVTGDHAGAIAAYEGIDAAYGRVGELDGPILCSYAHRGDHAGAAAFAARRFPRRSLDRRRAEVAAERPLAVEISGLTELPFVDDPLTPYMAGVAAHVNGEAMVARFDTGGSFLHLTKSKADALGIERIGSEPGFASLQNVRIGYGTAELELGPVRLRNVPVAVHETGPQFDQVGAALGGESHAIVGTNVFARFLTTIDAPGHRLLLSPRGDAAAGADHVARVPRGRTEVPFALWSEHQMIARGAVGNREPANLFVDSGLVVVDGDGVQASLLVDRADLREWRADTRADGFAVVPGDASLGPLAQRDALAYPVPVTPWSDRDAFGGIRIDALVSHGFVRRYAWTLDFDRYVYTFSQ